MLRSFSVSLLLTYSTVNATAADKVDFAHDVVPILKKHCIGCHGGKESKGGFSINSRELILDAQAVVPGDTAKSVLIELVTSNDPEAQMPPVDRPRVSAKEIATLRKWITEGLAWEAGFTFADVTYEPLLKPHRPELPPAVGGRTNPIDRIVDAYLAEQTVDRPSTVDDAVFLRRVYLDVVGLLPDPVVLARFVNDPSNDKRARLIRELLGNEESADFESLDCDIAYAEHWLTFWNDLLRNDYAGTGFITRGRTQISKWLYRSLVDNKPYDQMTRELLTPVPGAEGFINGIRWRGNVNASQRQELQFAQNVAQTFLGINLKCASCHDSFIDRWTLEETYGLAQVFSKETLTLHRCEKPIDKQAQASWLFPTLGEIDPKASQPERLQQLAALMTHPENGRFTRTIANRIWHRLMGRGIVHPVDAMQTEPWSSDLLDFLATDFAGEGYNLKHTIEMICTSEIYQSAMPVLKSAEVPGAFVFRGPQPRKLTAEQFVDAVWQITGAAPVKYDAPVIRVKLDSTSAQTDEAPALKARWIWSTADAAGPGPKGGDAITVRRRFELKSIPVSAIAAVTCDNEYAVFLNGRNIGADTNWETVELLGLQAQLKQGTNELLIAAKNGGAAPNPAGLIFEARVTLADETQVVVGTDESWEMTTSVPDARGRFRSKPTDWKPATLIRSPQVWASRVEPQMISMLSQASSGNVSHVRASLLKADELMRALGRPNRDQIVTSRPTGLTTLEAIDLANGQRLADAIAAGAIRITNRFDATPELVSELYQLSLSRNPTQAEAALAIQFLGEEPTQKAVEDLLWAVVMLPEFQLVR